MNTAQGLSTATIARSLKIAGLTITTLFFIDCITFTIQPNWMEQSWVMSWASQIVDRGVVAIVGVVVLLLGLWLSRTLKQPSPSPKRSLPDLWFWSLLISGLLGIIFLILTPLYFNSSRLVSAAATRRINEETAQAEVLLANQLQEQQNRVTTLLADPERMRELEQQLQNPDLSDEMRSQLQEIQQNLQQAKENPAFVQQRVEGLRNQGLTQIRQGQLQARNQVIAEIRKSQVRTTLSSLLLAIGFLTICFTGIKSKPRSQSLKTAGHLKI